MKFIKSIFKSQNKLSGTFFLKLKDTLDKLSADEEIVKIQYNQEYEIKKQLDSLKHLDEIRLQKAETRAKEEEIKAQKKVETALFIGIFLVIGFLGFVYKQVRVLLSPIISKAPIVLSSWSKSK